MRGRNRSVLRRRCSGLLIFVVLFAQAALSAFACAAPVAGMAASASAVAPVHCHGHERLPDPLCATHCQNDGQAQLQAVYALPAFAPSFTAVLRLAPASPMAMGRVQHNLLHATSPPLSIRHCRFTI